MKGVIKFSTLAAAVLAASMTLYSTNAAAAGQADIDAALAAAREAVAAAQRAEAAAVEAKRAAEAAQAKAEAESARAKAIVDQAAAQDGKAANVEVGWKPSFDFHGYFRAGVGKSGNGAQGSWNKTKVGRLGNESDLYSELEFGTEVYRMNDVSFYIDSLVQLDSNGSNDGEDMRGFKDEDMNVSLRQFNLQVKGLIPGQKDAVIWAGKRYYQRADIHVIDSKYINISGPGAGIEYLKAGPGTFSFAWFRADSNDVDYRYDEVITDDEGKEAYFDDVINVNYLDARYAGWAPWDGAWTQLQVAVAIPDEVDHEGTQKVWDKDTGSGSSGDTVTGIGDPRYENETSVMVTAELSQSFSAGYNKTILQYFNKALAHNAIDIGGGWYDSWNRTEDADGYSIINTGEINITDDFSFTHVLHYGYASDMTEHEDNHSIIRAVARAGYQLTTYTRLLAEVGSYWEDVEYKDGTDKSQDGQKYTLAYAIAPAKGLMSRPELRVYASYIAVNGDDFSKDGDYYLPAAYGTSTDDSEWNFGIQAEAWW